MMMMMLMITAVVRGLSEWHAGFHCDIVFVGTPSVNDWSAACRCNAYHRQFMLSLLLLSTASVYVDIHLCIPTYLTAPEMNTRNVSSYLAYYSKYVRCVELLIEQPTQSGLCTNYDPVHWPL